VLSLGTKADASSVSLNQLPIALNQ